jgi:phosphatidylinositol alpha-1,6-mannosyltransferase
MMRFLMLTQTFPPAVGGMQTMMHALAKGLSSQSPVFVYTDRYSRSSGYKVCYWPMIKPLRALMKCMRLGMTLRRDDIIICDSWKSLAAVPASARHVVVMAHGQEYIGHSQAKRQRVQSLLQRATHLIANSQVTLSLAQSAYDLGSIQTAVIPPTYGIPASDLDHHIKQDHTMRLLSICRLEPRKGLQHVVEVLGALKHCTDFEWSIVGQGDFSSSIRAMIEAAGLSGRVKLLGYVNESDKQQLLQSADVFVMPSYQEGHSLEGFGIAYTEAARYGVASIAGVDGGVSDAVIDGFTGWNVDPLDKKALAAVVKEALLNHERTAQLGFNARQHFNEVMSADVVMEMFRQHACKVPVTH